MNKLQILLNEDETACRVSCNGFATPALKCELHSFDHAGQEALTIDIEEVGEFISYDDGQTWENME